MRLGLFPAVLAEGSLVRELYGTDMVEERHRHRYEVNNAYRARPGTGRAALLRPVARRPSRRVRRAVPRGAPVLRGHPGAPGVPAPGRPGRTRCSPGWSPRRGSGPSRSAVAARLSATRPRPAHDLRGSLAARAGAGETRSPLRDLPESWPVLSSVVQARGPIVTLRSDQVQMPDHEVADRAGGGASGRGGDRRPRRGGPGADDPPVPAPGGPRALGAARRACGTSAGSRCGLPPSANCWRRRDTRPATGASWSTSTPPRVSAPSGSASSWPVTWWRFRRRSATSCPGTRRPSCRSAGAGLDEALAAFIAGDLHNGSTAVGILSAYAARSSGFTGLRPADAGDG